MSIHDKTRDLNAISFSIKVTGFKASEIHFPTVIIFIIQNFRKITKPKKPYFIFSSFGVIAKRGKNLCITKDEFIF